MKIKFVYKRKDIYQTVTVDFAKKEFTGKDTAPDEYDFMFEIKKNNFVAFVALIIAEKFTEIKD